MLFLKKTLIATPESKFKELRPGVESLYCCDTTFPSSPQTHLNISCVNTIFDRQIPDPKPNTAYYEPSTCYQFLPKAQLDLFDTVLMFRIVDLGTQIKELGLIKKIAPHLKKGGYFIGSGGWFPLTPTEKFFQPLNLETLVGLPNLSNSYLFRQNMGVVLKK